MLGPTFAIMQSRQSPDREAASLATAVVATGESVQTAVVPEHRQPVHGLVVTGTRLREAIAAFLAMLEGRNLTASTLRAYGSDLAQFLDWLALTYPPQIQVD